MLLANRANPSLRAKASQAAALLWRLAAASICTTGVGVDGGPKVALPRPKL